MAAIGPCRTPWRRAAATTITRVFSCIAPSMQNSTPVRYRSHLTEMPSYRLRCGDSSSFPQNPETDLDIDYIATAEQLVSVVQRLSLIHISEPTRLLSISYAVF